MELSPKLAELTPKAMEITPQVLEIVTGRPEGLNNRAANAYVVSGKGLSARRDPASQGTYFFIRFWVGKVNSCASVTAPLLSVAKTRNCAWPVFNFLPPRMVAVYLI